MLKKTKFYVGITLIIQSFSFIGLFIALCRKKKNVAGVILAIAAVGGITGAVLLYLDSKDEPKRRKIITARDVCCSDEQETACDREFPWDKSDSALFEGLV